METKEQAPAPQPPPTTTGREPANWAHKLGVAGFGVSLLSLALGVMNSCQAYSMNQANQRPWLLAVGASLEGGADAIGKGKNNVISSIKNSGQTPAIDSTFCTQLEVLPPRTTRAKIPECDNSKNDPDNSGVTTVAPGHGVNASHRMFVELTADEIKRITQDRTLTFFYWGWSKYTDQFGGDYTTPFCFHWDQLSGAFVPCR